MSNRVVLLVEDDRLQAELILRIFDRHGIIDKLDRVVLARDGEEALDFLFGRGKYQERDTGIMPKFVLLDLNIPKVHGLEVLQRVRADRRTRLLPMVVFSSSGSRRDVLEGYRAGANSYVTKPTDFNKFSESLKTLGRYWLELNESPPVEKERTKLSG